MTGLDFLNSCPPFIESRGFTLETAQALMAALDHPQDKVKTIHITGTNGKGSTGAILASMIYASGATVGHYTSPHLTSVTERCLINGLPVPEQELDRALLKVMNVSNEHQLTPSYFEAITAAAFLVFAEKNLDYVVTEVGLGGRLDATNTIKASELSLVTTIALDHTTFLGNSLTLIAAEKAGVMRRGKLCLVGPVSEEPETMLVEMATVRGAHLELLGVDFELDRSLRFFYFQGEKCQLDLTGFKLLGEHQLHNLALAVRAALALGIHREFIEQGAIAARWPGRLEEFNYGNPPRRVILDGAHNVQGVEALLEFCSTLKGPIVFICSILAHKDWPGMLSRVKNFLETRQSALIIWTKSENPQALDPDELRAFFQTGEVIPNPKLALDCAATKSPEAATILIFGSLYLLGDLRAHIAGNKFSTIITA
ncbi:hypothetical protein JNK13_08055 [bacterium]|nr:hypothetical protein [bacterium]